MGASLVFGLSGEVNDTAILFYEFDNLAAYNTVITYCISHHMGRRMWFRYLLLFSSRDPYSVPYSRVRCRLQLALHLVYGPQLRRSPFTPYFTVALNAKPPERQLALHQIYLSHPIPPGSSPGIRLLLEGTYHHWLPPFMTIRQHHLPSHNITAT